VAKVLNAGGPDMAPEPGIDPVALSRTLLAVGLESIGDEGSAAPRASELRSVDPAAIEGDDARIAFWANVYNTLLLAIQHERPFRGNVLFALRAFGSYAYDVGGANYSLNLIEHGVLRCNRRSPSSALKPLRRGDRRLDSAPSKLDPRVHFVLNCGARSCPPIRIMGRESAFETLELAARSYLQAETDVDADRGTIELPGLLKLYRADFGNDEAQLRLAARYIPQLDAMLEQEPKPRISHAPFDWRVHKPERAPGA
jgi:hypothetical protein